MEVTSKELLPDTFEWLFNKKASEIGGFIVGWNEEQICYLGAIEIDSLVIEVDEEQQLRDVTYKKLPKIYPVYLSSVFGRMTPFTRTAQVFDPINCLTQLIQKQIYLSSLTVFYTNMITGIELTYTNISTNEDYYCSFFSECGQLSS